MSFFQQLQQRNKWLYALGFIFFISATISLGFLLFDHRLVDGFSLWSQSFRFTLGSGIYVFSLGWLSFLINNAEHRKWISIFTLFTFSSLFSILIIQLLNGKIVLYSNDTPFDQFINQSAVFLYALFLLLQVIITVVFFRQKKNVNSQHYTWGVRMAMLTFTLFNFFVLGLIAFLFKDVSAVMEWLLQKKGIVLDIHLSFFMGFHSIQIIPLLSYYLFDRKKQVVFFSASYLGLIVVLLLSFILRSL